VQREIHNFGGDASRVIIHGQSSGASCVELHMVMPGSRDLIRGLVSESGGLGASEVKGGVATAKAIGKLAKCSGSSLKSCLQQVHPETLTSETYNFGWGPHIDNVTIPAEPMSMLMQGHINNFSMIMGANTNDSNKGMQEYPLKVKKYEASVLEIVGQHFLERALALYPPNHDHLVQNLHILGSINSDHMLCGVRQRISLVNKHLPGKAFMYRFNYWYQSNPKCTADPNYHDNMTGPRHEDEVTFVMGQPIFMFDGACCGKWGARLKREPCKQQAECVACWDPSLGEGYHGYFNDKEWDFSQRVGEYWSNLARYGTPNKPNSNDWPAFSQADKVDKNIVLDANLPLQHKQELTLYDNPAICSFWDEVDGFHSDPENVILTI